MNSVSVKSHTDWVAGPARMGSWREEGWSRRLHQPLSDVSSHLCVCVMQECRESMRDEFRITQSIVCTFSIGYTTAKIVIRVMEFVELIDMLMRCVF